MRTSLEMVSQFVSDENLHGIPMALIDICDKFEEWEKNNMNVFEELKKQLKTMEKSK